MKNQDVVSNLKLRAGWGVVGNDRITNYLSLTLYSQSKYGYGNSLITVLLPSLPNEDPQVGGVAEYEHRYRPGSVPQPVEHYG